MIRTDSIDENIFRMALLSPNQVVFPLLLNDNVVTVKYRYTLRFTIASYVDESLLYHCRN